MVAGGIATTETRTERWQLKCRRCKHIITREVSVRETSYPGEYYLGGYRPGNTVVRVDGTRFSYPRVVCPICGNWERDGERAIMAAKRIHGVVRQDVPCDARCTYATGSECQCSCGGANHGLHYAG